MPNFNPSDFTLAIAKTLADKGFSGTAATLLQTVGAGKATPEGAVTAFTETEQALIAAKVIETNITIPYRMWEVTIRVLNGLDNDDPIPEDPEYQVKVFDKTNTPRPLGAWWMLRSIKVLEKIVQDLRKMGPDRDPEPDSGPPRLGPGGGRTEKLNSQAYKIALTRLRERFADDQRESHQYKSPSI